MTTQPEALRLADLLCKDGHECCDFQAAAELRRLHAENEVMRNVANRGGHIAAAVSRIADLEAQRDALLEALRALVRNEGLDAYSYLDKGIGTATAAGQRWLNARAAIKAVEETK